MSSGRRGGRGSCRVSGESSVSLLTTPSLSVDGRSAVSLGRTPNARRRTRPTADARAASGGDDAYLPTWASSLEYLADLHLHAMGAVVLLADPRGCCSHHQCGP